MDDMRQHISLSRRLKGIAKPRLCNMAAERYRQSKRPRGSDEPRGRCWVSKKPSRQAFLPQNRPGFRVIARPQRGRGNLKVEGMGIPWRSTGARSKRESLSQKTWIHCFILLPLSLIYGSVSFRATIVRYGMANRFVKDCCVGRTRPPRNDRIGRFDRKHGTQNPIFGFRKAFLICCLILTVPDFLDSLKRPRGSNEPRGRCCLCWKLCAADFRKLSVRASAGLHSRCVRLDFQPIFQVTMESPYLIIS